MHLKLTMLGFECIYFLFLSLINLAKSQLSILQLLIGIIVGNSHLLDQVIGVGDLVDDEENISDVE